MLLLTAVFFIAHPHNLFSSLQFQEHALPGEDLEAERADSNATAVAEGSPRRRFSLTLLGLVALGSLIRAKQRGFVVEGSLGWLAIAFLAFILLSPVWADNSFLAVRRSVAFVLLIVAAAAVARRFSIEDLLLFSVVATASFAALGIVAEVALGTFRPWASGYRFSGTLHPNRQGMNCALLAFAAAALAIQKPRSARWFMMISAAGVGLLILTASRTSFAAAAFGFLVFAWLVFPKERLVRYGAVATVGLACALAVGALAAGDRADEALGSLLLLGRDSEESGVSSLNGRIPLWTELGEYVTQRPWLGYGYKSFWTPDRIVEISHNQQWSIMAAHNGYLEMALNIGIVGALLFVGLLGAAFVKAAGIYRRSKTVGAAFATAVLGWLGVNMIMESRIDEPLLPAFVSLTLLVSLAGLKQPLWQRSPARICAVDPPLQIAATGPLQSTSLR